MSVYSAAFKYVLFLELQPYAHNRLDGAYTYTDSIESKFIRRL